MTTKSDFKAIVALKGQPDEKEVLFQRNAQIEINLTTDPDDGCSFANNSVSLAVNSVMYTRIDALSSVKKNR